MNSFFLNNTFFIDEKIALVKNSYKVYNTDGQQIGTIQENMPSSRMILSLFISKKNLPFELVIKDTNDTTLARITRGWTFFLSKTTISDENGREIAKIKQKFSLKPKFEIVDMEGHEIGKIKGDWLAWDFTITDNGGDQIGTISKKWNGIGKELFTSADKYVVDINSNITDETQRIAISATAATIDMILKESK